MNDRDWKELTATSDRFDEPGRFVTVPGSEWTSPSYGHRNVSFRDAGAPMFMSAGPGVPVNRILDEAPRPTHLWRHLDDQGVEAITVPTTCQWRCSRCRWSSSTTPATTGRPRSTPAGATPWSTTARCRPMPSGCPSWPSSTPSARAGGSGSWPAPTPTTATPGVAQGKPSHPYLFHDLGSGRVAVLADGQDRHAVFEAVAPLRPGHRGHARPGRHLPQRLAGGHDRAQRPAPGAELDRPRPRPGARGRVSYFAKISRADHEGAWTSPIWVNGSGVRGPQA
jgi:hypothetical protein